jgi:acetyltransferase EpsM
VLGFVDADVAKRGRQIGKYIVLGTVEQTAAKFEGKETWFLCAVGDNYAREKMVRAAEAVGWKPATLVHPSAIISPDARIGAGSYIAPGCVVSSRARVGSHVIVNFHVSVGHDSILEDYAQICPGARVSGRCRVGKFTFMGSDVSLMPGVVIGDEAVVGANSHAVRNVAKGITVVGCPAQSEYQRHEPETNFLQPLDVIRSIFQEIFDDPKLELRPSTNRNDIPNWDSVAQLKIVLAIDEAFGTRFTTSEGGEFHSVGDFLRALEPLNKRQRI